LFGGAWSALQAATAFDRVLRMENTLTAPESEEVRAVQQEGENVFVSTFVSHLATPEGTVPFRGEWTNGNGISTIHTVGGNADFADHGECWGMMAHEKGHEVMAGLTGLRTKSRLGFDDAFSEGFGHVFGWFVFVQEELAAGRIPRPNEWVIGMEAIQPRVPMLRLQAGFFDPIDGQVLVIEALSRFRESIDRTLPPEGRMLPMAGLWTGWTRRHQLELTAARRDRLGVEAATLSGWEEALPVPVRALYFFAALFRAQPPAAIPRFTPESARVVHFLIPYIDGATAHHQELFFAEADFRDFVPFTGEPFFRGDANMDGRVEVSDAVSILLGLFADRRLPCLDAADANDDARINIADPSRVLGHLFGAGPPLPDPTPPRCGSDRTLDEFFCERARNGGVCP